MRKDSRSLTLRELRRSRGLTRELVAGSMNRTVRYVMRLERKQNLNKIGVNTLRRYVRALGGKLEIKLITKKGETVVIE